MTSPPTDGDQLAGSAPALPAAATPAVAVAGLSLQIGGARIVTDVTLSAAPGELLGVIGPNGAGKTTLFNLISGVHRPTAGRVFLGGDDVTDLALHRRAAAGLGRTFQTSNLFPRLTVIENVRLAVQARLGKAASILRFARDDDEATTTGRAHLAEVGLDHRATAIAGDLSHGDKRKLEVAVLLGMQPSVVLLDEPMAGVATGDVPELTAVIRRLHRELGCTVLMVEHHIDVVLGLVDTVAVMHHGELLAWDRPEVVMADPEVQRAYLGDVA